VVPRTLGTAAPGPAPQPPRLAVDPRSLERCGPRGHERARACRAHRHGDSRWSEPRPACGGGCGGGARAQLDPRQGQRDAGTASTAPGRRGGRLPGRSALDGPSGRRAPRSSCGLHGLDDGAHSGSAFGRSVRDHPRLRVPRHRHRLRSCGSHRSRLPRGGRGGLQRTRTRTHADRALPRSRRTDRDVGRPRRSDRFRRPARSAPRPSPRRTDPSGGGAGDLPRRGRDAALGRGGSTVHRSRRGTTARRRPDRAARWSVLPLAPLPGWGWTR